MAGSSGLFITRDERRAGNVTGNPRIPGRQCRGRPESPGPAQSARGSGLDRQVPQLGLVGDQVQRGDAAARDGETDDRDRLVTGAEQGAGFAVHQHRLGQVHKPRRGGQDLARDRTGPGERPVGRSG